MYNHSQCLPPTPHQGHMLEGMSQDRSIIFQTQRPGTYVIWHLVNPLLTWFLQAAPQTVSVYWICSPDNISGCRHSVPHHWHFLALSSAVARPYSPLSSLEEDRDIISLMLEVTKINKDNYFFHSLICTLLHEHMTSLNSAMIIGGQEYFLSMFWKLVN